MLIFHSEIYIYIYSLDILPIAAMRTKARRKAPIISKRIKPIPNAINEKTEATIHGRASLG